MVKIILIKSPDEWATTKQACRDELVVYLSFSSHNIYTYIYIYIYVCMYVFIYVFIHPSMRPYIHVSLHLCIHFMWRIALLSVILRDLFIGWLKSCSASVEFWQEYFG